MANSPPVQSLIARIELFTSHILLTQYLGQDFPPSYSLSNYQSCENKWVFLLHQPEGTDEFPSVHYLHPFGSTICSSLYICTKCVATESSHNCTMAKSFNITYGSQGAEPHWQRNQIFMIFWRIMSQNSSGLQQFLAVESRGPTHLEYVGLRGVQQRVGGVEQGAVVEGGWLGAGLLLAAGRARHQRRHHAGHGSSGLCSS